MAILAWLFLVFIPVHVLILGPLKNVWPRFINLRKCLGFGFSCIIQCVRTFALPLFVNIAFSNTIWSIIRCLLQLLTKFLPVILYAKHEAPLGEWQFENDTPPLPLCPALAIWLPDRWLFYICWWILYVQIQEKVLNNATFSLLIRF